MFILKDIFFAEEKSDEIVFQYTFSTKGKNVFKYFSEGSMK